MRSVLSNPRLHVMPSQRILLVDWDESSGLRDTLAREGYYPIRCANVDQAEQELGQRDFDVILLDITSRDQRGFDFCADLRNRGVQTPVLMLTTRGDVNERVTGLRIGADDCLPKPFAAPELLARIDALCRRGSLGGPPYSGTIDFGEIHVNLYSRSVRRSGRWVHLSRREFQMLSHLIRNQGRVVPRDELLRAVWGHGTLPYTRTVDVHMWQLRCKLEAEPQDPRFLLTVHGSGYLFIQEDNA
jgi:two-component system alkaline phosphatase synthesis response regulator PhoP